MSANTYSMKDSATRYGLRTFLLIASTLAASAVQTTTYQVDMTWPLALGVFGPGNGDQVFVSGTFSNPDWQYRATDGATNYILAPSVDNTNIYVGTFTNDTVVGNWENHKFVINRGGDFELSDQYWERNYRYFQVPAGATNLDVVPFDDLILCPTSLVTFHVDMTYMTWLGDFDPGNGDVALVAGDWDWGHPLLLAPSLTNTNVWEGSFNLTNLAGTIHFKYLMNTTVHGTVWEINAREFGFPCAATNLPTVFFDDGPIPIDVHVTFRVNLMVENAIGTNFTPGAAVVSIIGDEAITNMNWPCELTQSATNINFYSGTFMVYNAPGATWRYKYVVTDCAGQTCEGNVGPGGGQYRQFTMTGAPMILPLDYFNNRSNLGLVSLSNSAPGQATLRWATAGNRIRVEGTSSLVGHNWETIVTNTLETNSATVNTAGNKFFRLIGP
jgi:hypothetical protein